MTLPGPAFPKPTAQIEPFHRVLGPELTIAFLLQFGGAPLHLADNPKGRGAVEHLVGEAKTRELAQALKMQGHSNAQIARTLRATDVSVSGWLRGG